VVKKKQERERRKIRNSWAQKIIGEEMETNKW
jgi:hypothetical protein